MKLIALHIASQLFTFRFVLASPFNHRGLLDGEDDSKQHLVRATKTDPHHPGTDAPNPPSLEKLSQQLAVLMGQSPLVGCPNAAKDVRLPNKSTYQNKAVAFVASVLSTGNVLSNAKLIQNYVLACLYHATHGDYWGNNDNWLDVTTDLCGWEGVDCGLDGRIEGIFLISNNLTGTVPCELVLLSADHPSQAGGLVDLEIYNNPLLNTASTAGPHWLLGLGSALSTYKKEFQIDSLFPFAITIFSVF